MPASRDVYKRQFGYDSFDDSSSDYDDRTALAVDYCVGDCVPVIIDRLAKEMCIRDSSI